jgi:hypothetical protein
MPPVEAHVHVRSRSAAKIEDISTEAPRAQADKKLMLGREVCIDMRVLHVSAKHLPPHHNHSENHAHTFSP